MDLLEKLNFFLFSKSQVQTLISFSKRTENGNIVNSYVRHETAQKRVLLRMFKIYDPTFEYKVKIKRIEAFVRVKSQFKIGF